MLWLVPPAVMMCFCGVRVCHRSVLPKEALLSTIPSLINLLSCTSCVVHSYAATAIDKLLALKVGSITQDAHGTGSCSTHKPTTARKAAQPARNALHTRTLLLLLSRDSVPSGGPSRWTSSVRCSQCTVKECVWVLV